MSEAPRTEGFVPHAFAPQAEFLDNTETNRARPLTDAVITVRVIKNFEYRTMKALVLHVDHVNGMHHDYRAENLRFL